MLCYNCAKELDPNRMIKKGKLIRCEKCRRYTCSAEIIQSQTVTATESAFVMGRAMGKSEWIQARQIGGKL